MARRLATTLLIASLLLVGCVTTTESDNYAPIKAAEVNAELGEHYLARGELDTAKDKLEKALEQNSNSARANNAYAMLQVRLRRLKLADEHFQRAIELDPDHADYSNTYGIFLCGQGRLDAAERQFLKAAENPLYRTPEYAYDNAGLCALDAAEPARAEGHIRSALKFNPRFSPALLHMARAQYEQGQQELAQAYLGRYHKFQKSRPQSLWLGVEIARSLGDREAAANLGEQLLTRFPQSQESGLYLQSRGQ